MEGNQEKGIWLTFVRGVLNLGLISQRTGKMTPRDGNTIAHTAAMAVFRRSIKSHSQKKLIFGSSLVKGL